MQRFITFSQAVSSNLCPELEESSPYNHILFLKKIRVNIINQYVSRFPNWFLHFRNFKYNVRFSHNQLMYMHRSSNRC
jgi:hypothetical protein